MFVIGDISTVWVLAEIDEAALGRVKVGLPVSVSVSAYPDERFPAKVTLIGDVINPATRRVVVRCEAANAGGVETRSEPGLFALPTTPPDLCPVHLVICKRLGLVGRNARHEQCLL